MAQDRGLFLSPQEVLQQEQQQWQATGGGLAGFGMGLGRLFGAQQDVPNEMTRQHQMGVMMQQAQQENPDNVAAMYKGAAERMMQAGMHKEALGLMQLGQQTEMQQKQLEAQTKKSGGPMSTDDVAAQILYKHSQGVPLTKAEENVVMAWQRAKGADIPMFMAFSPFGLDQGQPGAGGDVSQGEIPINVDDYNIKAIEEEAGMSINQLIQNAREHGYTDDEIRQILEEYKMSQTATSGETGLSLSDVPKLPGDGKGQFTKKALEQRNKELAKRRKLEERLMANTNR